MGMALRITQWGTPKWSGGFQAALQKQVKALNFGGASKITCAFDPFGPEKQTRIVREAIGYISEPITQKTNYKCSVKLDILNDRSDPRINVLMNDGSEVELRTINLTLLETLSLFNEAVSAKAPKKVEESVVQTKAEKAAYSKRK